MMGLVILYGFLMTIVVLTWALPRVLNALLWYFEKRVEQEKQLQKILIDNTKLVKEVFNGIRENN